MIARWTLGKYMFELMNIREKDESKLVQYENGKYEHGRMVETELDRLNQLYKTKLRNARLESFFLKGFY